MFPECGVSYGDQRGGVDLNIYTARAGEDLQQIAYSQSKPYCFYVPGHG